MTIATQHSVMSSLAMQDSNDVVVAVETLRRAMTSVTLDAKIAELMAATASEMASVMASSVSVDCSKAQPPKLPKSSSRHTLASNKSATLTLAVDGSSGGEDCNRVVTIASSSSAVSSPPAAASAAGAGVEGRVVDAGQFNVWRERRKRCKRIVLQFIAFLCSTIGLCCVLCAYALLGGFIFRTIEVGHEVNIKEDVTEARRKLVMELWNYTMEVNVFHEANWTDWVDQQLTNYSKRLYVFVKETGWDGKFETSEATQWTYVGSLLYSVTVITTIGYGHIAPKTTLGRVVTMFYAIFGIPLNFLTMANVGQFLAIGFRFLYRNVVRGVCCVCWREPDHDLVETLVVDCSANGIASTSNGKPPDDGEKKRLSIIEMIEEEEAWHCLNDDLPIKNDEAGLEEGQGQGNAKQHYTLRVYATQSMRNLLDFKEIKKVNVPIYVSVLTVFTYILFGAMLFSQWEGWEVGQGMYFCFVTLTTIGFGDVIPGTTLDAREETQSQEKLGLCALYIFFGLALIAMCFDLVQQDIRVKFRRLGQWLGILEAKAKPDKKGRRGKGGLARSKSARPSNNRTNGPSSNSRSSSKRAAFQRNRNMTIR